MPSTTTIPTIEPWTVKTMGAALWDMKPTATHLQARQLAMAMGYPLGWYVVREVIVGSNEDGDDDGATPQQEESSSQGGGGGDDDHQKPSPSASSTPSSTPPQVIVDRIYAGHPTKTDCNVWYHHDAAMQAAATWEEGISSTEDGGHKLPRQAKYQKGDLVQAFFENQWWDARIVRRNKEHPVYGWRYQVHYEVDNSKQPGVPEDYLRPRPWKSSTTTTTASGKKKRKKSQEDTKDEEGVDDPHGLAVQLGFDDSWMVESKGQKRYKITSPSGIVYHSKTKALEAFQHGDRNNNNNNNTRGLEEGDPPWRTTGHELLGRRVRREAIQAVTARRSVTVVQYGQVTGWIAATDVDQAGQPGYRSETSGQPAELFHIAYEKDSNHPYPSYTITTEDLEHEEVVAMLV
jgi:hypothetical protein